MLQKELVLPGSYAYLYNNVLVCPLSTRVKEDSGHTKNIVIIIIIKKL